MAAPPVGGVLSLDAFKTPKLAQPQSPAEASQQLVAHGAHLDLLSPFQRHRTGSRLPPGSVPRELHV